MRLLCFDSLQVGKTRKSCFRPHTGCVLCFRFPFPSRGKDYTKTTSVAQLKSSLKSFHSLHAGKTIQSQAERSSSRFTRSVSIPFKREVSQKPNSEELEQLEMGHEFPFPSRGKDSQKTLPPKNPGHSNNCFNSLHAGKTRKSGKQKHVYLQMGGRVSIPFTRERLAKAEMTRNFVRRGLACFHSLHAGKSLKRKGTARRVKVSQIQFPFPSRGKVSQKRRSTEQRSKGKGTFHSLHAGKSLKRQSFRCSEDV